VIIGFECHSCKANVINLDFSTELRQGLQVECLVRPPYPLTHPYAHLTMKISSLYFSFW
jgi:hypothetical protein